MAEVMRELISLGFQRVVVFVFDFPAGATGADDFSNILLHLLHNRWRTRYGKRAGLAHP